MPILPMFPLGSVLVPSVFLPLHIFEPRYRELARDCLAGEREFGVVLIERGSEVGGGDTRESVGTVARILEAVELPDGRWAIGAVGTRRIRVREWLADDPYPRADVEDWDDPEPAPGIDALAAGVVATLRQVLALRSELGDVVADATHELSSDPVLISYQATALSPFGPADQQSLLEASSAEARLSLLAELLAEDQVVLDQRLHIDEDHS
jgi:Lon protease-like protein